MEESQVEEKKGGSTVGKFVGALGGGVGAYKLADTHVARKGISAALEGAEKIPGSFETRVDDILAHADHKDLKLRNTRLDQLRGVNLEEAAISEIKFSGTADKGYKMHIT